jgi:hypothetical protein
MQQEKGSLAITQPTTFSRHRLYLGQESKPCHNAATNVRTIRRVFAADSMPAQGATAIRVVAPRRRLKKTGRARRHPRGGRNTAAGECVAPDPELNDGAENRRVSLDATEPITRSAANGLLWKRKAPLDSVAKT